ncbi:recombination-associated protein RdgC [Hydrocarboniclastica marina]|uniref:Recombination-associated protein RdgC n=1 Tax=Hydrocarboniclastica marina TaxID=2259620 RepID=A0A4P7XF39_9ALTE|nr:recombination-associated protein RdgC [Hydrocarboniclastica marina]MAL97130.1 recombination-associated protein RdgC [Alteromonadaceae bacterium]QCF25538.1 recombination-associated protein RdgC [Hydrocarboniclastica marina]|tara:strand:- start:7158 stop:8084 length:927 start_codon:yes stop_codon:yes gene_type:complete
MWFRNARFFRFSKPFNTDPTRLEEALNEHVFKPCGPQDSFRQGWVSPLGRQGEQLVHSSNGYHLICLRKEERVLPSSVVKEVVAERIELIETEQGRKVGRKEQNELRDQVTLEMLPQAFTRSRHSFAYLAPADGLLVVDSGSSKQAEDIASALRQALGSLPVRPPVVQQSPAFVMTGWINGDLHPPTGLVAGQECELRDTGEEGGIIRCRGLELHCGEIRNHIESGMQVTRLALDWEENLSFLIDEELTIKRLKFGETLRDQLDDIDSDDKLAKFDGAFSLMTLEISRLVPVILEAFGGEDRSAIVEE